ncbi:MAG: hypothetical protein M0Q95_17190 [Porticoccaceae bacterium]|nr:hypothetical protein [Porticoccaceae bacterium]
MAAAVPIIKVVGVALSAKAAYDGIKEGNFFKAVVGAVGAYYGVSSLATPATAGGASGVAGAAEGAANSGLTAGANAADKAATAAVAKGIQDGAANVAVDGLRVGADNLTRSAAQTAGAEALGGAARSGFIDSLQVGGDQLAKRGSGEGFSGLLTRTNDRIQQGAEWIDKKGFEPIREAVTGGEGKYLADGTLNNAASASGESTGLLSQTLGFAKENPNAVLAGGQIVGGLLTSYGEQKKQDKEIKLYRESLNRRGSPVDISRAGGIRWNPETRRFNQEIA